MPVGLKGMWQVTAGLIPGTPMPEYTRRWAYDSMDHEKDGGNQQGRQAEASVFRTMSKEAHDYAQSLDNGGLNFVMTEFVWF